MSFLKIAHLSDPHFGTILPGVREGLLATLRELKPDLVLFTGDITQRARRAQFLEARAFLEALKPVPAIAVPGNHDIPLFNIFGRLLDPYHGFQKLFVNQLEKDFRYGDVEVIGLNSTSKWRHVQGDFNLERVEKRLGLSTAKVQIAAFHHPVDCAKPGDVKNLLKGRDATMALFERHKIDLVIGGHIHDPFITLSSARYPKLQRTMIIGVAGTCLSSRTRSDSPNSFHWIEVDSSAEEPQMKISRYDQRPDLRFGVHSSSAFVRRDGSWARA